LSDLGFSASMLLAETSARVQLLEGDWAGALASFDRLSAVAASVSVQNPSFVPWRVGRCTALAELGRLDEGAALADENLRLARAFGCPMTVAEALACVARFADPATQIGLLEEAITMLSGTPAELLRCNLFIELGFARHHSGDAAEARTALREGADQATRLGASRLAGVAGRGLLACGARPRRLHTSGRESLTPAEIRVVRLAAMGQTNGAIAEALFINMKTVESHLTRAYRKLGITDRAELADALGSHMPSGGYDVPKVS
jgi:DNA-binding CsgD family transcriptional regulator